MTISTETSKNQYDGNDSTTVFPYDYKIAAAAHLGVYLRVVAAAVETKLVLDTDYTVSGVGEDAGGNVTYPISGDPLAAGETLTINREAPILQPTDLENQGGYFAETQEDALDLATMISQDLQEQLDRCPKVDVSGDLTGDDLLQEIEDAVDESAASAAAALVSETNAAASETAAGISETNAGVSETNAAESAAEAAASVADVNLLKPEEQETPNNTILVLEGHFVNSSGSRRVAFAGGNSPAFGVVTANSRIDLLTINDSGTLGITVGAQDPSPSAPLYPTNVQVLAHVLINETGTVVINTADITDARFFLNLSGGGGSEEFREDYVVGTPKDNYTGSTTIFDLADSYVMGGANLKVRDEGVTLTPGIDYTETDIDTVTMILAVASGRRMSFVWAINVGVGDAGAVSGITASAAPEANKLLALDGSVEFPASTIPSAFLNTPNILVNGGMEVWQRGNSFVIPTTLDLTTDKWEVGFSGTPNITISRESSIVDTGTYALKFSIAAASGTGSQVINYIENFADYRGKTLTFSARVRASAASKVRLRFSDGVSPAFSSYHTGGGAYELLSVSIPVDGAAAELLVQIGIIGEAVPITDFYIDSAMLVIGSQSIAYVPENPQTELAGCERYYEVRDPLSIRDHAGSTSDIWIPVEFSTPKSASPTVTIDDGSISNVTSVAAGSISTKGFTFVVNPTAAGDWYVGGSGDAAWISEV